MDSAITAGDKTKMNHPWNPAAILPHLVTYFNNIPPTLLRVTNDTLACFKANGNHFLHIYPSLTTCLANQTRNLQLVESI